MTCQADIEGEKLRKGPWLEEEDEQLTAYVNLKGNRRWDALAKESGLRRSGRSCRMRWLNYLRPNLKHGHITVEEEKIILHLHERWGNKWSKIARMLPGRTDNEIKNYWRTHLKKKEPIQDVSKLHLLCLQETSNVHQTTASKVFSFRKVI
ncbi:transcription factor MYB27 [Prunus yedoensis var. nudiflora]|uniref:Transcription factor MYB27 n=1 Tax=Prunus yedoensis var. nudiflora TaxID=2094558 RepID=A0A314UMY7_PRUYE|nr:transcription factor MYB27 [Prunus yedoensis var. nudiflora]